MFRLAHISDVHLGPLPEVSYRDLASKRAVGYINWQRNRRRSISEGTLSTIVADIKAASVDHLAITGDLVNLALDAEQDFARIWLETLGNPHDVSVVPGNHDAYVPGAFDKACRIWAPWMTGDGITGPLGRQSFPFLRVRGPVAIIGATTARATAPFMASGFFREPQAKRMAGLLDEAGARGLFRVVLIHHPPVRAAVPQHKRLYGIARFQSTVMGHGAELVLHGHSHIPSLYWIGKRGRRIPVVGVAAGGQAYDGKHTPAQYNLIQVSGESGAWSATLTRRGLTGQSMPVAEIARIELTPGRAPRAPAAAAF